MMEVGPLVGLWEVGKEQGPVAEKSTAVSPGSAGVLLPGALL